MQEVEILPLEPFLRDANMRMWLVPTHLLCRKHLLGEHVELHMLVGTIKRGCSLQGYIDNKLIDTTKIQERHEALVKEMTLRGYKHNSPLTYVDILNLGSGLISETASLSELSRRCPECARRQLDDKGVA